jgi:sorting nexin-1/2
VYYYTLRCSSSLPGFPSEEVTVRRRFSDFDQLHHMLRQHHQGYFIPPLPSKSFFESKVAHTDSFLRVRRVDLQVRGLLPCGAAGDLALARARRWRRVWQGCQAAAG